MYVLRSKVAITDVSEKFVRLGVAGKNAEQALNQRFPQLPQQAHALASTENGIVIRLPGLIPRFEVIVEADQAPAFWDHDRKSTRLNYSHSCASRMPTSACIIIK